MLTKSTLMVMVALVAIACATAPRSGSGCASVPVDRRSGIAEVYQRCEVDTRASLPQGMPRPNYTPSRTTSAEAKARQPPAHFAEFLAYCGQEDRLAHGAMRSVRRQTV